MMIEAPWTEEQVKRLNRFQRSGKMHPFTCGKDSKTLYATPDGWWCSRCREIVQDWAHDFMMEVL